MVVPNSPGLIIVEVDIPFSVGLREEGMGQDTPRSIKWQVVPMPVPAGAGGRVQSQQLLTVGLSSEGFQATGLPGEVDHDVGAALMHFSKGEWCHVAPHL